MLVLLTSLLLALGGLVHVHGAPPSRCAPSTEHLPQPSDLPVIDTLPDPFTFRLSDRRVHSRADWECRREELMVLVQQYLYGFYPDRSRERVRAQREGNNLMINISVGEKRTSFPANITFPPAHAIQGGVGARMPVVIATGPLAPVNATPFLESGVAVAEFDVNVVANDSYTRIGAFWDLYGDRDIGEITLLLYWRRDSLTQCRRHDGLGLGGASYTRRD